ncbi:mannonate dehydratase [Alkaliphilus metalliredigens QYMF]|uniref:Mannonate dehydratase n=1 Tax=Alkaliphilus metalliredigens (strain QYMF) TaxID=293826 RepID=A6TMS9_ALKMQ|nr:mannonate dehydratase [Alkaliphilus metalliredigens]ABR47497.1 mannonate dehydratase [Alkaliphilus metalliredigens QYMF]
MILRWFPDGDDSVTLEQIKQTPGVSGVATCLPKIPVGDVWELDVLEKLKKEINDAGLEMEVIESVNIHEDIKKGLPSRDKYINNYIKTIENLSKVGVKVLCYNFMPVIDWARSDLAHRIADGSSVMAYRHDEVVEMNPASMAEVMKKKARGYSLPGWEPERLKQMAIDIEIYKNMSTEAYWENMKYFLDAVIPYAEKYDVQMAIHPDDPPWPLYGLPKVINNADNIRKFLRLNPSRYNGLTLCTGSLGADSKNDIPAVIREFSGEGRIHFAHIRNLKHLSEKDFDESAHLSECGDLDMFEVVKAYQDTDFDGYIRPDHGRMIWGEKARPGYGLYDRALGANYILGLWEAIEKMKK